MAREWTPEQAAAIATRDRSLLVSAAAGSGKTATLTERIIQTLTDPETRGDISRMLIVTFTRAAAGELRARISDALQKTMEKVGPSAHLSRQLLLLPGAHISTIDSFCLDLVRTNATRLGLSPSFRLADPAENLLLLHSVMTRLLEDCYEGVVDFCTGAEFCDLVDCLTGSRGDATFGDTLLSLYDKTQGFARSHRCIGDMAKVLKKAAGADPFDTPWGAYLRTRTQEWVDTWLSRYRQTRRIMEEDLYAPAALCTERASLSMATETPENLYSPDTGETEEAAEQREAARAAYDAYAPALDADIAALRRLKEELETDYTAARAWLYAFPKEKLKPLKKEKKTDAALDAAALRTDFFKQLGLMRDRRFAYTVAEWQDLFPALAQKIDLLGRLLSAFDGRVWEEKKRRGICAFADLSHAALRLLQNQDGTPTPISTQLCEDYDAVYIDEYQDVNEIQHLLFERIAAPRARFMVGDIKQSIYGFRGAQPEIFAAIRQAFPPLSASGDGPHASLSLAKNFRSLSPILDFANLIFGRLMEGIGAHIGYRADEDALIPGRPTPEGAPRVTVALFEKRQKETESIATQKAEENHTEVARADDPRSDDEREDEEAAADEAVDEEALYVAQEIKTLLQTERLGDRPLYPGDIAILVRRGASGERFVKALASCGIRGETISKRGFFVNPEILLALSLLNVVDNPRRDVYLAGLLRSPLYGFTMDDLIALRQEADLDPDRRGCSLYEALCLYSVSHPEFEKGHRFLERLEEYRRRAEGQPVDRFIWYVYRETGLLSLSGGDKTGAPAMRHANLMLLYDYARRFEASSYRGLYNFIAYINEAIARGQSIEEGHTHSDRSDTVRIMTVHQSKGLEFPVCFLPGCEAQFVRRDAQGALVFDRHLGPALKLRDKTGFSRIHNPVYSAVAESILAAETEEEARVLYVALTRPRERLYVSATMRDPHKAVEKARAHRGACGAGDVYACRSFADMILTAAGNDTSFDLIFPAEEGRVSDALPAQDLLPPTENAVPVDEAAVKAMACTLQDRFSFVYPYQHETDLPGKLSVSRLYPTVLDGADDAPPVPGLEAVVAPVWTPEGHRETGKESPALGPTEVVTDHAVLGEPYRPRFMGGGQDDTAARAGTATHIFMQFCDFQHLREAGARAELARLQEAHFLSTEDAARVRLSEIEAFAHSSLLDALLGEGKLYREWRFHARIPAAALTADPDKKAAYGNETVLVQGVMDGVLVRPNGDIWLFDYKTDRLTAQEKRDPTAARAKLEARHALQLSYYQEACRQIFGRAPARVMIYSLPLGDCIDITVPDIIA